MRIFQRQYRIIPIVAVILCFLPAMLKGQVSPISGLGSIQLLDNTGVPATSGCFYFYAAGTSTQQATFTDSTGATQNTNPLCLGSGARATGVWLTTSQFYKIVACLANDGATCNASDILWSQDQVPGGASGGGGAASCASGCTGFFVSGTATPSTAGTLRLASGDSFGWRNAAGSANLLFSKDSNDLLSWAGGSLKFPEVGAPAPVAAFDILTANNTVHRWQMGNNGAALDTVVGAATVDTFTNKTFNAQGSGNNFQIGGVSISATGQSATTFLRGDGTWATTAAGAANLTGQNGNIAANTLLTPLANGFYRASCYTVVTQAATTSSTLPECDVLFTDADSSFAETFAITQTSTGNVVGQTGPAGAVTTLPNKYFYAKSGVAIQYQTISYASSGVTPMLYAIHVRIEGPF